MQSDYTDANGSYGSDTRGVDSTEHKITYDVNYQSTTDYTLNADGSYSSHTESPKGYTDTTGDGLGNYSVHGQGSDNGITTTLSEEVTADGHGYSYQTFTDANGTTVVSDSW